MISIVGAIFLVLCLALLSACPDKLSWTLSAAFAFMATAGFNVAGQSIATFHFVAAVMITKAVTGIRLRSLLAVDLRSKPGLTCLLAFGSWCLAVTIVGPVVFAGIPVLNPRSGIDAGVADPAVLAPQISNFAQSAYLVISILLVVVLGTTRTLSPRLPALGFTLGTTLSSLRSLLPEGLQRDLFDNSANVTYTSGTVNGVERMRGIFSEPSSLGAFSVTATVFFIMTASRTRGWPRHLSLGMSVWTLVNASLAGSGTALVGGLVILGVVGVQAAWRYLAGRSQVSATALVATLLSAPIGIVIGPTLYAQATGTVGDKVDSSSYANRSTADLFSIDLSLDTYGVGVGLGANRPSSFSTMLLSCTGVLGALFFLCAILPVLVGALRHRDFQPAAWALVSLLFSKIVAGPDLSDPTMWILLAVCANASWPGSRVEPVRSVRQVAIAAPSRVQPWPAWCAERYLQPGVGAARQPR